MGRRTSRRPNATQRARPAQPSNSRWWTVAALVAVGGVSLIVFGCTLAPTVTAEDSGELIAAAWHFGVPHPPGYPLWTMLCGAFMRIVPVGSIAFRANLFSAVCTAGAAVLVCAALRELRISRLMAASAALVWVFGRWSWAQAVITEVYGLNALLTAALLWCGLRWYRTRSHRPLYIASVVMGLGMCNHHTIALAGLAMVIWILLLQPALLRRWKLVISCIGLFLVSLLPYLYLPLSAGSSPPMNWGNPSSSTRFWAHVSRSQYGAIGPMKTVEPRSLARLGPQVAYLARSVADDLTPWCLGAAILGAIVLAARARRILLLVVLWLMATGLLFGVLSNYDLDRTSQWAMRVFLIPVSLGLVIPLAYLLDWLRSVLAEWWPNRRAWVGGLAGILAAACPAVLLTSHWRQCDYSAYWYAHDHAQNMLRCMLPRAMVFPSGDHATFPLVYLTLVEAQRRDVLIADMYGSISPELYADRPPDAADTPEAWLIKQARRPVYYATKSAPPVPGAHFVTAGILYHLLPDGMPFDGDGLLEQCTYRNPETPTVEDFGAAHIRVDYAFFRGLARLEAGDTAAALAYFEEAARHGAGIKEVFNNLGSALAEHRQADAARDYFRTAADLDPHYITPRRNLYRIARLEQRWSDARNVLKEILSVEPDDAWARSQLPTVPNR